jgi:hypothetical protein
LAGKNEDSFSCSSLHVQNAILQAGHDLAVLSQAEAAVEPEAPVKPSEEDLWYRKMAEPTYFQVRLFTCTKYGFSQ